MILSGTAIRKRLERGEIFVEGTWNEACIKEASYTLRVAGDGMLVNGKPYPPGTTFPEPTIRIEPGSIVVLSTVERFKMPADIVGHQGIRFNYAVRGLTGLMGIQVDPLFGSNLKDERLYLRFANLGNDLVEIKPMEAVFNIEFQQVDRDVDRRLLDSTEGPRGPTWDRLLSQIADQQHKSWSYATRVQVDLKSVQVDLRNEVRRLEKVYQPVVMFGVFLVAATLLGAVFTVLLSVRSADTVAAPPWVTTWVWVILLASVGVTALTAVGICALAAIRQMKLKREAGGG